MGVGDGCAQAVSFAYIPKRGKRSPKISWNCCIAKGMKGLRDSGFKKPGKKSSLVRGVAHDREEKKHLQAVDEDEDSEKDIKAGKGQVGEGAQKAVG